MDNTYFMIIMLNYIENDSTITNIGYYCFAMRKRG